MSRPVRFAGRRHHAYSPVPTNDQPTSSASAASSAGLVDVVAREDDRQHGQPEGQAGDAEGDEPGAYSPTARFGASPHSCSSR